MKIFIVGLGLIGASYAQRLHQKNHQVYGYDKAESVRKKALMQGVIKDDTIELITSSDIVILALYPQANIDFVKTYKHLFTKDQIITDVSGVKTGMVEPIEAMLDGHGQYVSHHPMAGSEKPGFEARNPALFEHANMIIIETSSTSKKSIEGLKTLAHDLGFKKTIITTPQMHDALIAYTSQLPHTLAIALINANTHKESFNFAANSYKDLTRIASINAAMWSELFISNKTALSQEMAKMIHELQTIKHHIDQADADGLKHYMSQAKERRDAYGNHQND